MPRRLALALAATQLCACAPVELPEDWLDRVHAGETISHDFGVGRSLSLSFIDGVLTLDHAQGWLVAVLLLAGAVGLLALCVAAQLEAEDWGKRVAGGIMGLMGLLCLLQIGDSRQRLDGLRGVAIDERDMVFGAFARTTERALDGEVHATVERECELDDEDQPSCAYLVRLVREGDWTMVWLELGTPTIEALNPGSAAASREVAERLAEGLDEELERYR